MKTYLKNCKRCEKETRQIIIVVNRKRGVKLRCLECGRVDPRWYKKLKEEAVK